MQFLVDFSDSIEDFVSFFSQGILSIISLNLSVPD